MDSQQTWDYDALLNEIERLRRRVVELANEDPEEQDIYQQMFTRHSAVQLLLDPDTGDICDANTAAAEFYGYPIETLRKMNILDINTQSPEQIQNALGRARAGDIHHILTQHRLANGEIRDVEVFPTPVHIRHQARLYATVQDVTECQRMEEALRRSQERYRELFEHSPISIWEEDFSGVRAIVDELRSMGVTDLRSYLHDHMDIVQRMAQSVRILDVNQTSVDFFQAENKDQLMYDLLHYFTQESLIVFADEVAALVEGQTSYECEVPIRSPQGEDLVLALRLEVAPGYKESLARVLVSFIDITERKHTERQMRTALAEKETLLQELYHRTKNNMQVISSLLSMQASSIHDEAAQDILKTTQNRIHSMALVHQKLYQSQNLSRIELGSYVQSLVSYLEASYSLFQSHISIQIQFEPAYLGIDSAIPFGLILNELLTNAFKHAFPGGRHGQIKIHTYPENENRIVVEISDNGIGMPAGFHFANASSLGWMIIHALTKQLHGEITFENRQGVHCRLSFPDNLYRVRV